MLITKLVTTTAQLAAMEGPWNALAGGMPLRSWTWLATWWAHYGAANGDSNRSVERRLRVIAVYEPADDKAGELVGVAPWYLDGNVVHGNVIRPLGSGEVCTDHLSLVCRPADAPRVAAAIADYLTTQDDQWDRLELGAVDADDPAIARLADELDERECLVSRTAADNCWVIDLPQTWDEFLAAQSKSHRKQLRRFERRVVDTDRVVWHAVHDRNELDEAWHVLVDLHQRRRRSLGEPGCFASRPFRDFHGDVVERLLANGQLRMSWLELDGSPAAAEYHLAGPETTYAYQSGVDPTRLDEEPGRLSNMLTIQRAIAEGHRKFDFLRGDEPYKAHWRATPRPTYDYRIVPNRRLARLRGRAIAATETVTDWVKQSARLVTRGLTP
jgi:CelD/BcsL family acetyltransferase involved in cellulose biosynthesis